MAVIVPDIVKQANILTFLYLKPNLLGD